ncbi:hypothetical protein FZEAL_4488 [Fusarium zealandicum]|uniref:Uncharacterized protein n=1 Tax=Fusarium zealandicum TaxID=1053134 RepID=A0A8H4ULJ5_9HYPO|nr:hypothetical protein FZEAL_4488 [Fusarium zealandicum]
MAAASLTRRDPEIQEIAASAPRVATEAVIHELKTLFESPNTAKAITNALIVSVFCLSSSLCWMDHKQLGLLYLHHVRVIISLLEMRAKHLAEEDQKLVNFFKKCLIYEEAARSIVTCYKEDISTPLEWTPTAYPPYDFVLHAWTGVPPKMIGLFGKTILRGEVAGGAGHKRSTSALEETLLSVEEPDLVDGSNGKSKDRDRLSIRLHHAAEVFRLPSLVQLYQTFPDLVSRRLPDELVTGGSYELIEDISDQKHFTDIGPARDFILDRLKGFSQGPAAGSIAILRELLQAVWSCYDSEVVPGPIHWLDVMADLMYETVFG